MLKHTPKNAPTPHLDEEFLGEIDIFEEVKESAEDCRKRKARLDALEDMRHKKSLREQIDYLYDQRFVRLNNPARQNKKNKAREFE